MNNKKSINRIWILAALLTFSLLMCSSAAAFAAEVTYQDTDSETIAVTSNTYVIKGNYPEKHTNSSGFTVKEGSSTEGDPITIILDNVCVTQRDKSPKISYIKIEEDNYVIIKLRGTNYIEAWSHDEIGSNDGMSGIHVSRDATVKVTDESGDGRADSSLEVYGGGGKYGGAGIGARYNAKMGTVIIAGGSIKATGGYGAAGIGGGRNDTDGYENDVQITGGKIEAYGGYGAAGIGSGRDGKAYSISISGGEIYAEGGEYGAGIGAGDSVSTGTGGNLVDLSITGGSLTVLGGSGAAGIGCSEGGALEGDLIIRDPDIKVQGGYHGAGIGGGDSHDVSRKIEITGTGTIITHGGKGGAGIGGGNDAANGEIYIVGDTIADESRRYGTRGEAPEGSRGLTITATGSRSQLSDQVAYTNEAAAIGSGKATGGDITIKNAVLYTNAGNQGADIGGGGYHVTPSGTVKNIVIDNCEIQSSSRLKCAPGIGAGYGGTVDNITITNTTYSGSGIGGAPMDYNYTGLNDVKSITIDNSDITAIWDENCAGDFTGGMTPSTEPQEHGAAGIGSGQYGAMGQITITDSNINTKGFGSGSGIGGGGAGGNGFMVFDFTKWSVGDTGTIEISGSDVHAESGKANFDDHSPITYYDGQVWITIDVPNSFGGGAGIGGGSASDTDKVYIHDCGEIYAKGEGGGIGSGDGSGKIGKGAVDYIWLENIDKLEAHAGNNSAGIGTGGVAAGINSLEADSGALKQIYIRNCRDLKAYGGCWGAGIGCGSGSPSNFYFDDTSKSTWPLSIIDSKVYAEGGNCGAGIGGGFENVLTNKGGENPNLLIQGDCQVEAKGGDVQLYEDGRGVHGGGAGIGGGCCGAAGTIQIDVTEDYECAAKGTYVNPEYSKYYVKATGGGGGAGIGSGGRSFEESVTDFENADSEEIEIKKGAIFARGSGSPHVGDISHFDFFMGAGAGIGGGSKGSKIKNLKISGGFIDAFSGECMGPGNRDKADDIGAGGNPSEDLGTFYNESDRKNGSLEITDGTIFCETIGTFKDERKISGGSVSAVLKDATGVVDTSGEKVYQTTAKIPKNIQCEKVDGFSTSRGYGGKHIYTDVNCRVYLYLYEKGSESDHQQWADIEVNTESKGRNNWHYTGYTDTSHTGILKIDGAEIPFRDPGTVHYGDDFILELDDDDVAAGAIWQDFAADGSASIAEVTDSESPGVKLKMHADSVGAYTVSGSSDYSTDNDCYWGSKASFAGTISKGIPELTFTEDPSKVYDTLPAVCPSIQTASTGEVTYQFYTDRACSQKTTAADGAAQAGGAPSNAGEYWVEATAAETELYESTSATQKFSISPAPTVTSVGLSQSGSTGTAVATVAGLYEAEGTVDFTVTKPGGAVSDVITADVALDADGMYSATLTHDTGLAGEYTVEAVFRPSTGNYSGSSGSASGNAEKKTRGITGTLHYYKQYGDIMFWPDLQPTEGDALFDYDIIWDSYESYGLAPAVYVNLNNSISVKHAGSTVLKVTMRNAPNEDIYLDVVTYITVDVSQADLTVTPYAFKADDSARTPVSSVKYGNISSLDYDLRYSAFVSGDDLENFTSGLIGSISAAPVPEKAGASDTPYQIGITYTGAPVAIDGEQRDIFFSRDYNIIEDTGRYPVKVNKAALAVSIDDASGIYGEDEPGYTWQFAEDQTGYDGLAPWDSRSTVFSTAPVVGLDDSIVPAGGYKEMDAGAYNDAVIVKDLGVSANYDVTFMPGYLTIEKADISDRSRFDHSADDTVYSGLPQRQEVKVTDEAFDPVRELVESVDFDAEYPGEALMTDAGTVAVKLTGKGRNYTGEAEVSYRIRTKEITVETESAEKRYDGTPLTAGGEIKGLVNGETAGLKITGTQTEVGQSVNTASIVWNGTAKESDYTVKDSFGVLTVTEPVIVYSCTGGDGSEWAHGSGESLEFRFSRNWQDEETFGRFESLSVDGKTVSADLYEKEQGSIIITLKPSFLDSQVTGDHRITAVFDDGSADASYRITKGTATVVFTEDPSKVYDTEPVRDPGISTESTGRVSYEYFTDEDCTVRTSAASGAQHDGEAPVNAGTYWVKATVAASDLYESQSASMEFQILQAPTAVSVVLSRNGESGRAEATISGLYAAEGTVIFTVSKDGTATWTGSADVTSADGLYKAEVTHDSIPAGEYTVTAQFIPGTGNYKGSAGSASGNKDLSTRSITGITAYSKKYGDGDFSLDLSSDHPTGNDSWTYEVISDTYSEYGAPQGIRVDESGNVTIDHAGTAVIRATLSDGRTLYDDISADIIVDVSRAELTVASFAFTKGTDPGVDSNIVRSVPYGKISSLDYGLRYDGFLKNDDAGTFTHGYGTLEAVPIPERTGASEKPQQIRIKRNTVPVTLDGKARDIFISRDYEIKEDRESYDVTVTKAALAVVINDASGVYGWVEPEYSWSVAEDQSGFDGLAPWDDQGSVFETEPKIIRKGSAAGRYTDLDAGTYENVLDVVERVTPGPDSVERWNSENYEPVFTPGTLTVTPAPLLVTTLSAVKEYDGSPLTAGGMITGFMNGETAELVVTGSQTEPGSSSNTCFIRWNSTAEESDYSVTMDLGTLTVTSAGALIRITGDPSKVFDGKPASDPEAAVQSDGDVTYEYYTDAQCSRKTGASDGAEAEGKAPVNVGKYWVRAAVSATEHFDSAVSDPVGFEISPADISDKERFDHEVKDTVYNGSVQKQQVTVKDKVTGKVLTEETDVVITYPEDSAMVHAGTVNVTAEGTGNYRGTVEEIYEIMPKQAVVKTASAEKVYDGTPLTAEEGDIDGFAAGETASLIFTGTQTSIGESDNTCSISWDGTAEGSDYTVTYSFGTLKVTAPASEITITGDPSKTYDGLPASDPEVHVVSDGNVTFEYYTDPSCSQKTGEADGAAASGKAPVNAGEYWVKAAVSATEIYAGAVSDPAGFVISPADISDEERFSHEVDDTVYNGSVQRQQLTVDDKVTGKALEEGRDVVITYPEDSAMIHAGTVDVEAEGKGNYRGIINESYVIAPKQVSAETAGAEKVYDGTPLTADEGSIDGLVDGETASLVITGSQTDVGESDNTSYVSWDGTASEPDYSVSYTFGKLKVTEPETEYYCYTGDGGVWKYGSSKGLSFTFKRNWDDSETIGHFKGVKVDNKKVAEKNYDVRAGSVVITLEPAYLEKLKNGKHVLTAEFNDGDPADADFTITGKPDNDDDDDDDDDDDSDDDNDKKKKRSSSRKKSGSGSRSGSRTGDESMLAIWLLLMLSASAELVVLLAMHVKK